MKYFWLTLKHKWFVFLASFKTGLPIWLAITHDLSKFSRKELLHYNRQFFGDKGDPEGFALAWLHHQNCNENNHHWEWWIMRSDHSHGGSGAINGCLPMSDVAILHMITDWVGAGRSYKGSWDISEWVSENLPKMKMHPITRTRTIYELTRLKIITREESTALSLQFFGIQ